MVWNERDVYVLKALGLGRAIAQVLYMGGLRWNGLRADVPEMRRLAAAVAMQAGTYDSMFGRRGIAAKAGASSRTPKVERSGVCTDQVVSGSSEEESRGDAASGSWRP